MHIYPLKRSAPLLAVGLLVLAVQPTAAWEAICVSNCGGGSGNDSPPVYYPPPVYSPSPEEIARNQATEINNQGVEAQKRDDLREAIRLFELAVRTSANAINQANLGDAYNNLGVEFAKNGDWEEALKWFLMGQQYRSSQVNADNIAKAQAAIAGMAREAQRKTDLAAAQQRTSELLANLRDNLPGQTSDGDSAPPGGGLDFMDANEALTKAASLGAGLDFMDGAGAQAKAAPAQESTDTPVVDARGQIGSLPTGLPRYEEVENSPGRVAWLRGMDAVAVGDWELATAWFGTAQLRDPANEAIREAVARAQWTRDQRRQAGPRTANSSVAVPTNDDLEFLRADMNAMVREMAESLSPEERARLRDPSVRLPTDEDLKLLFDDVPRGEDDLLFLHKEFSDPALLSTGPPVVGKEPDARTHAFTGLAPGAEMPMGRW